MRHTVAEGQTVLAPFDSGDTVTIELWNLSNGSVVALNSNSCSGVASEGIFKWNTSQITTQPTVFTEYLWKMSNSAGTVTRTGKITIHGWPETANGSAALTSYDPPTKAELDSAVAPLATEANATSNTAAIIVEIDANQADIAAAIVSLRADIRELRRGNLLMELTAATNIDSVRKVAVGCLDSITYKTKADADSDWTSPTSTKTLYAWYTVLGSKNPYKMGEDG